MNLRTIYLSSFKRIFDISISFILIILTFPIQALLVFLMTINLKEFGLFRQVRIGYKGKEFFIYKIKTMVSEEDVEDDGVAALSKHRVSRLGSILRRLHFDELPQFFSVFFGKMSIIGPRPEVKSIMEYLSKADRDSWTKVRPGLISPATLSFINEEGILEGLDNPRQVYLENILPRKVEMNQSYVNNITFLLDLKIFVNYIRIILKND